MSLCFDFGATQKRLLNHLAFKNLERIVREAHHSLPKHEVMRAFDHQSNRQLYEVILRELACPYIKLLHLKND